MTLSISLLLTNRIKKECTISHLDVKIWAGKKSELPASIKAKIKDEYGENYLEDADYVISAKGAVLSEKTEVKTLFNSVNRALGNSANNLTLSDFKKIFNEVTAASDDNQDESVSTSVLDFIFVKVTLK